MICAGAEKLDVLGWLEDRRFGKRIYLSKIIWLEDRRFGKSIQTNMGGMMGFQAWPSHFLLATQRCVCGQPRNGPRVFTKTTLESGRLATCCSQQGITKGFANEPRRP